MHSCPCAKQRSIIIAIERLHMLDAAGVVVAVCVCVCVAGEGVRVRGGGGWIQELDNAR